MLFLVQQKQRKEGKQNTKNINIKATGKCIAVNNERGVLIMKMYKVTEPAIASYSLSTWHAIGVFEIDYTDDKMKIAWINGNERDAFRWVKVRYDKEGDAYLFTGGERRYLKDFM